MRDEQVKQSTTSKIITLTLRSATTGQFVTDAVAGDFSGNWGVAGGTTAALSFAAGAEGDAYSSGKVCPRANGSYDWHVPDSMLTALGQVVATISVTDVIDTRVEFQVVAVDREAANYGANTAVPPTVTEFNARTLPTADYFDPAADTVARVTLVDTTTVNTDMVGTDNASTHNAAGVLAEFGTGAALTALVTATGFSEHSVGNIVSAMQAVADHFKATGFSTHNAEDVYTVMLAGADNFKGVSTGSYGSTTISVGANYTNDRIGVLKATRDTYEAQLADSRVTSYTTQDGRTVNRESIIKHLEYVNKEISKAERTTGSNRTRARITHP